jgi:dUTP pyrophosphatase
MLWWKGKGKLLSPARPGDAGYDICSYEDVLLIPGDMQLLKTEVYMEIPKGYVGIIKEKSGLACSQNLGAGAGVIDSGYRGEVIVLLRNMGDKYVKIVKGQKIAQILFFKSEHFELNHSNELGESERGEKGFGSTGV